MEREWKVRQRLKDEAEILAKLMTVFCLRNTFIEKIHLGRYPESKTGDYSDVKVVTPDGEIPWNEIALFNQEQMKKYMKQIVNRMFTFLLWLHKENAPSLRPFFGHIPKSWDPPEIDQILKDVLDRPLEQQDEKQPQS
jgi:hypothetical protein